jgi:predicted ATPase/class 3 adenylate cyclase/DNA-binding CsgD family transcriptional regulator
MSEHRLPEGVVTFLLTDVEDSTGHWAHADAATAMTRQRELIAESVAAHGGCQPLEQGEGDSTVSVFVSASGALAAAVGMLQALADEDWSGEPVRVRVGIHTGEAALIGGRTYAGQEIIRCARLRDLGHGGQILTSAATAMLTRDALPAEVVLRDLSTVRLKGLDRPEHAFQLEHPTLERTFPALLSDSTEIRLPTFPTSFVARPAEISQVCEVLGASRLVTVTGTGGSGKTRLAHQVALALAAAYPDGVVWVDLSRVTDDARVVSEVAAACGLAESPGGLDPASMVEQHLSSNERLVVLDNCEHVLDGVSVLAHGVLTRPGRSVLLATSREPLGVAGEIVWRIPSLEVPPPTASAEEARQASAIVLFCERAKASNPDLVVDAIGLASVIAICGRLDGIPLAIELAAAGLRTMALDDLMRGLDDRFRILTAGPRSLERQRTLLASIDWSHNLLDDAERLAFRRLSVFVGMFTLDDAEAVIADEALRRIEVFNLVTSLVDKSLVQRVPDGYIMLESVRSYAAQRCSNAGELEGLRDRHFQYLCDLAGDWALDYQLSSAASLAAARAHVADLRAALEWGLTLDRSAASALVVALGYALAVDNRYDEFNALVQRALTGVPEGSVEWCELVASSIESLSMGGDWWQEGASIALNHEGDLDARVRRRLRSGLALPELMAGVHGAADLIADLIAEAQADHDTSFAVSNSVNVAYYAAHNGDLPRAETYLAWAERHMNDAPRIMTKARGARIMIAAYRCEVPTLLDAIAETLAEPTLDPTESMAAIIGAVFSGSLTLMRALRDRLRRLEFSGSVEFVPAWVDLNLSTLEGDLETARCSIETILSQSFVASPQAMEMIAGDVALACGDRSGARGHSERALALTQGLDSPYVLAMATQTAAQIDRLDGEVKQALERAHVALDITSDHELLSSQVSVLENLALIMLDAGQAEDAARLLGACDAFRRQTGFVFRVPYLTPMIEEAKAALDSRHWDEGATLSLEDTVDYARRRRGARSRPLAGWDSLTPAEEKVVALVAEGLSNQEVADSLFVSLATVKTHLTHVFQKLELHNRTQLVNTLRTRESEHASRNEAIGSVE